MAYAGGETDSLLTVYVDEGEADPMPVSLFFRSAGDLREVDLEAMALARGRVLDVGAGVGAIALALQREGADIAAVEVIPEAVEIMIARGVRDVRRGRVQDLSKDRSYDTLLLLMNGIALAGTLSHLPAFLCELEGRLAPGGQIILESTDVTAGRDDPPGESAPEGSALDEEDYPGELQYQLEFEGARGAPFPQLFVDPAMLERVAEGEGLRMELVWRGSDGEYLVRLTREGQPEGSSP
jgi:SAM-dependent methyltransferase